MSAPAALPTIGHDDDQYAPPPTLLVSSQPSRFHQPASAAHALEIDIHDISMAVGSRQLLSGAHLQLQSGVRYGLIGRNGVGKSLFMKSLAYHWLPGVPSDLTVFYVDQLESPTRLQTPVIDLVMNADRVKADLLADIAALELALKVDDAGQLESALIRSRTRQLRDELAQARLREQRTTGRRGIQARNDKKAVEVQLDQVRAQLLARLAPLDEDARRAQIVVEVSDRLAGLYGSAAYEEPSALRIRAEAVLRSLRIPDADMAGPLGRLSGGWRLRVAFAMAMMTDPQVLLLDEPTNHLDLSAVVWLIRYLTQQVPDKTVIVVSHDRYFLDEVADQIIVLQQEKLDYHNGNYSSFVETRDRDHVHRDVMRAAIGKRQAQMQRSIEKEVVRAHRSGNDKALQQSAARRKKLEDRVGVERSALGHRFKLNRDRVGHFATRRGQLEDEFVDQALVWKLPPVDRLKNAVPIVSVDAVSFAYAAGAPPLLDGVRLTVAQGDRVAIVGRNGQGKTTLMKLLADELAPSVGQVDRNHLVSVAYLKQDCVDEMRRRTTTPLDEIRARFPSLSVEDAYSGLGAFGLGALARQPLNTLSGGQGVRVALALLGIQRPHALFLDEPTNHLDLDAIDALIACLAQYDGALVVISHDVYFVESLACSTIYQLRDGRLFPLRRLVDEYQI